MPWRCCAASATSAPESGPGSAPRSAWSLWSSHGALDWGGCEGGQVQPVHVAWVLLHSQYGRDAAQLGPCDLGVFHAVPAFTYAFHEVVVPCRDVGLPQGVAGIKVGTAQAHPEWRVPGVAQNHRSPSTIGQQLRARKHAAGCRPPGMGISSRGGNGIRKQRRRRRRRLCDRTVPGAGRVLRRPGNRPTCHHVNAAQRRQQGARAVAGDVDP